MMSEVCSSLTPKKVKYVKLEWRTYLKKKKTGQHRYKYFFKYLFLFIVQFLDIILIK